MFHRMMNYGELNGIPTVVLTRDLIKRLMPRYKRHDDLLVIQEPLWEAFKRELPIPVVIDENSPFSVDEDELASLVCQVVQKPVCRRLVVESPVRNDDYRTPNVRIVLGDDGLVVHKENHIAYQFDVTKCMFSFGNIREKMRMAELDCSNEVVVDLFAGIGYFSLPLLMHAKAKHLYACEWNPDALDALKKNLKLNKVEPTRCTVIEGDNKTCRPANVAQRVILGILPSCLDWMQTAFECIDKSTGAVLHCHDLVELSKLSPSTSHLESPTTTQAQPEIIADPSDEFASSSGVQSNQPSTSAPDSGAKSSSSADLQASLSELPVTPNQSPSSSSSSSHSTIEKLSVPSGEKSPSSDSDKDTNSPVFVEKPSEIFSVSGSPPSQSPTPSSSHQLDGSPVALRSEDGAGDASPIPINDQDRATYEARAELLMNQIQDQLSAQQLKISLAHIQPVKSYAPHINHVVFDFNIQPFDRHDDQHDKALSGLARDQLAI